MHVDGDMYIGDWFNDKAHGQGRFIHADGATYNGDWKDDQQEGLGDLFSVIFA